MKKCNQCNLEVYENEEKCIFHSDKETWKDDENWDKDKVSFFWKELNNALKNPFYSFNKKTIFKEITMHSNAKEEKINMISKCIIPPLLNIDNLDNEVKHYYFDECTFLDNFKIATRSVYTLKSEFNFFNCLFNGKFEVQLDNGICEKNIELRSNKHLGDIHFYGLFQGDVIINNLQKIDDNKTINIFFRPSLVIFTSSYKYIELSDLDNSNIEDIKFWFMRADKLIITNRRDNATSLNSLTFQDSIFDKLKISDLRLNNFSFSDIDFIENSKVLFEKIKSKDFKIKKITQDAKYIQFHHLEITDNFICDRVEFKNTYFNDFNISQAKKTITKTSFIDASLNSIEWGDFFKINSSKDIFRQLKFVSDKQGNHIDANNFYMMEMQKYRENIGDGKNQDKIVFYFNNIVSNFGQSWVRPFGIYLGFGLIFSILMFYFFPINDMPFEKILVDAYNPISKSIFEKYSLVGLVYKIVSGLIIYQLVIALKRQTKR